MAFFKTISARFALFMILLDRKNRAFASVRRRLDRFIAQHINDYTFMMAFDATLMFAEDRNDEGRARFSQCLNELPDSDSPETKYVSLYCRFNLNLHDEKGWKSARKEAIALKVDPLIKSFLHFPSEERVFELIEEAHLDVKG